MSTSLAHGFASMNGGTTGGSGGPSVTVTTGAELQAAINGVSDSSGPLTIYVNGTITPANSGVDAITIDGRDNISIIGVGTSGEFDGIGIHVKNGSSNLIFQNLTIHHVATGQKDAIGIEGPSRNIWIDSNEFYSTLDVDKDYYDGLLDIKKGAEYITVSENYFHDHHKVSLIGSSDSDEGARYITYDSNVFENIGSRAPSIRFGYAHFYNNYFKDIDVSGINVRMGAVALIENNYFENVRNPIVSIDSAEVGYWEQNGNLFSNVSYGSFGSNEAGGGTSNGDTASYDAPYAYTLLDADLVRSVVFGAAGVGKSDDTGAPLPSDPPPAEPPTTDPAPTDPAPAEPAPTEPAPTEPAPTDPAPTEPAPSDQVAATGGSDLLTGGAGDDTIDALGGADSVSGGGGNDRLTGGTNEDTLAGGSGDDILLGGNGRDVLQGDDGNDLLDGGNSGDRLFGGAGDDRLLGGNGDDALSGGGGADTLEGGAGKATLSGDEGDDLLLGGIRTDRLEGGLGRDLLTGGGGNDVFVYASAAESPLGAGHDVVTDWAAGDRFDLEGMDARAGTAADDAFAFIGSEAFSGTAGQLRATVRDGATWIEGDTNGDRVADLQIELSGIHALRASDFVL